MATLNDIPIIYINNTKESNFSVAVFADKVSGGSTQQSVVWELLTAQSSSRFTYPAKVGVGAEWTLNEVSNLDGPFDAQLGSTWYLKQPTQHGTPTLTPVPSALPVADGAIAVHNVRPDSSSWSGRPYDFGLFKNNRMMVVQRKVGVGASTQLSLSTTLNFGIVPSTYQLAVGDVVQSGVQYVTGVDLSNYLSGLTIILTYKPATAKYVFTPTYTPVLP